jgi:hypothetical protein
VEEEGAKPRAPKAGLAGWGNARAVESMRRRRLMSTTYMHSQQSRQGMVPIAKRGRRAPQHEIHQKGCDTGKDTLIHLTKALGVCDTPPAGLFWSRGHLRVLDTSPCLPLMIPSSPSLAPFRSTSPNVTGGRTASLTGASAAHGEPPCCAIANRPIFACIARRLSNHECSC